MAKKNSRAFVRANKNIQNIAQTISSNMDDLYRSTYMTSPQQNKDLEDLSDRINDSISKIVNKNMETVGMPSVSRLYARISGNKSGTSSATNKVVGELERMFDSGIMSDDLYSLFMSNRYLRELDNEIDVVCKYMPKLEEALAVQRDCILSADHFSKDFMSFENPGTVDSALFTERVKDLKKKYDLLRLAEEIYDDVSKYGEKFVYRVPYSTAIGKLLATKPDSQLVAPRRNGMSESVEDSIDTSSIHRYLFSLDSKNAVFLDESGSSIYSEAAILAESTSNVPDGKTVTSPVRSVLSGNEKFNIGLEINTSGIIESAVYDHQSAYKKRSYYSSRSMKTVHEQQVLRETQENRKDIQAKGNINLGKNPSDSRIIANDGLINAQNIKPVDVKVPGCVVKRIDERDRVIPIYIDDICMGYYFFEVRTVDESESFMGFKNILGDPLTNMRGDSRCAFNAVDTERQDDAIKYVAGQLSAFIDKQFVNANQDLAKEIYMILKYNDLFNTPSIDMIRVTFVPPEDMVHFFFKQDPVTHRGISDLGKGLIPAKIYSSLYITNAIANLTRGQDKRVYYVKQTVDTNIAQTLLNTINQIKQGNFGIRQFQNINNVLNITGKFNDFVIPTNASGDPPIQFEIMPGQDINTPTELMEQLEEMAINSTGIPIEIIQARQSVDYATQLTMSSSKVLRFCYKRQEMFELMLSELISPIYGYEYDETCSIKITLPPPSFINITNTNQLVDNTRNFVQSIIDIEMAAEPDDSLKSVYFNELFKYYIGTHLDISKHKEILERSRIIAKRNAEESHDNGGSSDY